METVQLCRSCGKSPRIFGSLYCEPCSNDMESFIRASRSREHPPHSCWCVDCTTQEQREFRAKEAQVAAARLQAHREAMSRPPFIDPDDPPPKRTA